jgi:hypothetical protein
MRLSTSSARVTCGVQVALERKESSPMPSSQQKPPAASDSLSFVLNGEVVMF